MRNENINLNKENINLKNISNSKCPMQNKQMKLPEEILKENNSQEIILNKKCPYNLETSNLLDEYNFEENQNSSGCPMMSQPKEMNTNFDFYYEIPFYNKNDFYFNIKSNLEEKEFREKTTKLRQMPRHLKMTLFYLKEEKIRKIREKEFTQIYFVYEEIREKAVRLFNSKKYKECLNYYNLAYSLFKWLEFTDKSRINVNNSDKLEPILDEIIEIKKCKIDTSFSYEEESFKGCLVTILKSMSFVYLHLRHFSEAIICLNEAIEYSDMKVPELFYRRSQARFYNKFSDPEKLKLALVDIEKAKEMNKNEKRFEDHFQLVKSFIEEKMNKESDRILKLLSHSTYAFNKIKEKNLDIENCVYHNYESVETNWMTLEEMRKSYKYEIKFHNELNNEKQIQIAYREYEEFMEVFVKFNWFYNLEILKIPKNIVDSLNKDEKYLFNLPKYQRLFKDFKLKSAEDIFSKSNFNLELLKFSIDKVIEEQKIKKEIEMKYGDDFKESIWKLDFSAKTKKSLITFAIVTVLISIVLIFVHYSLYSKKRR